MSHINPTTIEELLEMPDEIAKLSDEQLTAHIRRYFPATRPQATLTHALDQQLEKSKGGADKNPLLAKMEAAIAAKRIKK